MIRARARTRDGYACRLLFKQAAFLLSSKHIVALRIMERRLRLARWRRRISENRGWLRNAAFSGKTSTYKAWGSAASMQVQGAASRDPIRRRRRKPRHGRSRKRPRSLSGLEQQRASRREMHLSRTEPRTHDSRVGVSRAEQQVPDLVRHCGAQQRRRVDLHLTGCPKHRRP